MKAVLRTVLFLDALLNLALGVIFLFSPWQQLYASLQVPRANPPLFGQMLGVMLVGIAWLQWHATINGQLTTTVAKVSGHVNWITGVLILAWVLALGLQVTGAGMVFLPALAAVLIVFAILEIKLSHNVRHRERAQEAASQATLPSAKPATTEFTPVEPSLTPPSFSKPTSAATDSTPSATQDARQNPHS